MLENKPPFKKRTIETDPFCLSQLKHYHSLIPLGMEARKPVFALKPADGAFGGHAAAVQRAFVDFERLAQTVSEQVLNRMV